MSRLLTYVLETKTKQTGPGGPPVRGERIHKVVAESLTDAITKFAIIKQLRPDQLIEIFSVYEQPNNGK